jgi:hypothetical protein
MALFTDRMARISCIAMGGEVWFERHESIVAGRYFLRHDGGAGSGGGRSWGNPAEDWRSLQFFGRIWANLWAESSGKLVHLQIFLGARTT